MDTKAFAHGAELSSPADKLRVGALCLSFMSRVLFCEQCYVLSPNYLSRSNCSLQRACIVEEAPRHPPTSLSLSSGVVLFDFECRIESCSPHTHAWERRKTPIRFARKIWKIPSEIP